MKLTFQTLTVNHHPKLANCLKGKKISLNVSKTEPALFTSPMKTLDSDLKIKLNGKRLYKTYLVKYSGTEITKSLIWKQRLIMG